MNCLLKKAVAGFMMLCFTELIEAGPHTQNMYRACPDGWSATNKALPVIWPTTNPWSDPATGLEDKQIAQTHLATSRAIQTIDKDGPITSEDLVEDPLTVASECLVYRNFEVDYWDYVAPPASTPNTETGWIPASVL